ncbi:hypothetical protein GGS26DRAFT_187436 [Hypomontagnella submonticulosa]|nr:hypothetical protein GGS26DRAFT_187436 [Hypomontagnella submonticulosa]
MLALPVVLLIVLTMSAVSNVLAVLTIPRRLHLVHRRPAPRLPSYPSLSRPTQPRCRLPSRTTRVLRVLALRHHLILSSQLSKSLFLSPSYFFSSRPNQVFPILFSKNNNTTTSSSSSSSTTTTTTKKTLQKHQKNHKTSINTQKQTY